MLRLITCSEWPLYRANRLIRESRAHFALSWVHIERAREILAGGRP